MKIIIDNSCTHIQTNRQTEFEETNKIWWFNAVKWFESLCIYVIKTNYYGKISQIIIVIIIIILD